MTATATSAPTLDDARAALKQHFGYDAFRPGQETAIEAILQGRDTLVVLPTGGGKSLCYQVPALVLPGLTVVVSPLISLMKDQVDALVRRGIAATFVNSSLPSSEVSSRMAAVQRGDIRMLYVAPERFDVGSVAERLKGIGISLLAVDEAHCISEWGHDFRPSYLRMKKVRVRLGNPPTVALTATATPHVRTDIVAQLELGNPATVITGFDRTNLTYHVLSAKNDAEKDEALVRLLRQRDGLAVVYASSRKTVERVAGVLAREKVPSAAYHAGLDDKRRREVQDAFMKEQIRAIVATNAFGMGIDKPNVRTVVHHAMPGTLEAYYQEAGRAGRDGEPAEVFLLHSFPDRFTHEFFIKSTYPDRAFVESVYAGLQRVAGPAGEIPDDPAIIAQAVRDRPNVKDLECALRLLTKHGAMFSGPAGDVAEVRLLATPDRIKTELGPENGLELALLRAMWKTAGERMHTGAAFHLGGFPPGLGPAANVARLLDGLQSRQFVHWERLDGGSRLADRNARLTAFNIEWGTLDRRRRADLDKLDAMQRYAYLKTCRRGFVLRYFGDPAARKQCGGCDNCLGITAPAPKLAQRKKKGPRVIGLPGVSEGRDARRTTRDAIPETDAVDESLLQALRKVRSELAKEQRVPAYVVCTDRTLIAIATARPKRLGDLIDIPGMGETRIERYGQALLDVIREG
jgi:ATP-dependent DNA helicase RecQ